MGVSLPNNAKRAGALEGAQSTCKLRRKEAPKARAVDVRNTITLTCRHNSNAGGASVPQRNQARSVHGARHYNKHLRSGQGVLHQHAGSVI